MSNWVLSPILGVKNVREAAEYYRDVLGFHLDPDYGVFGGEGDEPGGVYALVVRDEVAIHFQIRRGPELVREREALERDVYVYVYEIDNLYLDLRQRGAKIVSPPTDTPYGLREMVVEDLNGYRLAFGFAVDQDESSTE